MSYEKLKKEIKEISDIASSVPEAFRERCFEVLLNHILAEQKETKPYDKPKEEGAKGNNTPKLNFPSYIQAFMRRTNIAEEQIGLLVMIDEENDLHFIKEPTHKQISRGQNEWALLLALKNGILHNSLKADPEDVRSLVQDKGYYDTANFSANFKHAKYSKYFKNHLKPQGQAESLSKDGENALAELIISLTS